MPFAPTSTSLDVDFDTDLVSTGVLVYGTSALNLSDSVFATSANGLIHNATITGLTQDTVYYYQAFGVNNGFTGQLSLVYSFRTPRVLDITTPVTQDIFATGAITLSGASSTGAAFTSSDSGSITLQSSSGSDSLILSLSGLSISSTSWNGIIEAPYVYSLTGPTIPDTGYTQIGVVYKAGNNSSPLAFTGQIPTLTLNVGAILNGISLKIYRSDDNISYTPIGTCVVASGKCVFSTNHFSYFTFGLPADSTPDTFSFASQSNAELSSAATSASITVSGINTSASISITGGSYSVNNGAYTSSGGFVVV